METIYSLAYNYFSIEDSDYANRAELTAFNALPAAVSADWLSHQYTTKPNQPFSKNLPATPFYDDNTQSQTFSLEPNYPCCTVTPCKDIPRLPCIATSEREGQVLSMHCSALAGSTLKFKASRFLLAVRQTIRSTAAWSRMSRFV